MLSRLFATMATVSWQLSIGLSVVFYSIAVLLQRVVLKDGEARPIATALAFQLIIAIGIGILAVATGNWQLPALGPLWLNLVLTSLLYGAANIAVFTALKTVEASKFTILFATRGLFTIVASSFLLSEGLNQTQLLGALFIFVGVVLVNFKSNQLTFSRGDWLALVGGLMVGLANTNDRFLLGSINFYMFSMLGFLLPTIPMALIYPKEIMAMKTFLQPNLLFKMILLCFCYGAAALTFFLALQLTPNSSQVAAVNLTSVIVIVLLAIVFLKESAELLKKMIGAVLSFVGLLLVSR